MPLADILCCPLDEVAEVITHEEAYGRGSWYLAKNISTIELSQLGEMLGVGSYDELMEGFELVGEPLDEGPWPQTIPDSLLTKLKTISDQEIKQVTPKWAKIEDFFDCDPKDLAKYLRE